MDLSDTAGTRPETVLHLRDVVRPLVVKMVAKRAAAHHDLLTADDRDDLVGVVMEKYHRQWGRGDGPDYLGGWLRPVVEASIVDELRRRAARPKIAAPADQSRGQVPFEELLVSLLTPSLQTHYTRLLQDALAELAIDRPHDPELIQLRYSDGLELAEIATRLGLSEETVKKRVQRATIRLRSILTRLTGSQES